MASSMLAYALLPCAYTLGKSALGLSGELSTAELFSALCVTCAVLVCVCTLALVKCVHSSLHIFSLRIVGLALVHAFVLVFWRFVA